MSRPTIVEPGKGYFEERGLVEHGRAQDKQDRSSVMPLVINVKAYPYISKYEYIVEYST